MEDELLAVGVSERDQSLLAVKGLSLLARGCQAMRQAERGR